MALTNLSVIPAYKERIVTLGAWQQCMDVLINFNPDKASLG